MIVQNRGASWRYDFLYTEAVRLLKKQSGFSGLRKEVKSHIFLFVLLLHFLCTCQFYSSSLMFLPNPPSPISQLNPLSLLFNAHYRLFSGVIWPGREADYSPPPSVEIKNEWRPKFTLPHAFSAYTATTWSKRRTFAPSSLPY